VKDKVSELIKICDALLDKGIRIVTTHDQELDIELIKSIAVCQELNPITLTGSFRPIKPEEVQGE
jgi:hypothetical protein